MPRKNSSTLFALIKSMNTDEICFFKQYAKFYTKDNRAIDLFNLLNQQTVYNEIEIKTKLYKTESSNSKFSKLKGETEFKLLASLAHYQELQNPSIQNISLLFKEKLKHIDILIERELLEAAFELLVELKEQAIEYECNSVLLEIFAKDKQLQLALLLQKKEVTDLNLDFLQIWKVMTEAYRLSENFYSIFYNTLKNGIARKSEDIILLQEQLREIKLDKPTTTHFESNILYSLTESYLFYCLNQFGALYQLCSKSIAYIQSNSNKRAYIDPHLYISIHLLMLHAGLNTHRYESVQETLTDLINIPNKPTNKHYLIQQLYYSTTFSILAKQGDFKEGVRISKTINNLDLLEDVSVQFYIAYMHFGHKNYTTASQWLSKIIQQRKSTRKDIYRVTRLLKLLCEYEQDHRYIEVELSKLERQLRAEKELKDFEKIVISFVRRAIYKTPEQLNPMLMKLLERFKVILNDKANEALMLQYFDFESWIESKVENISFASLKKRKFLGN